MAYAAFFAAVRDHGGYEPGEAEEVTEAVVMALGRRLPSHTAENLETLRHRE